MTRTTHGVLAVAVLVLWAAAAARAAEPDPRGKPEGMEPGQTLRWYVWHSEDGVWHVRTTTKSMQHEFRGTIRVVGGAIKAVNPVKLEGAGATKDWWTLSEGNKLLTLDLKTNGAMDGFDFEVGNKANDVVFTLTIDGKEKPELIYVGKKAANPSSSNFSLPAIPK